MSQQFKIASLMMVLLLVASISIAQFRRSRDGYRTAREADSGSIGTPEWKNEPRFSRDVFTFVRVKYSSGYGYGRRYRGWGGGWATDLPDSDLNFSYRLQQMTSLKVDPDGRIHELTDKELFDFPFIYIVEPGALEFTEDEVKALRRYLLNGGFLMVDDFWGERQWANFYREIKRVFPDREPMELEMNHPIFHCVFDLKLTKNQMQVPNYRTGEWSQQSHITWEYHDGEECRDVHFKGIFDDKNRMMVIICHNTDNGDGWEREGEYEYYFREFAEKKAYPLGINIVFYAMTH